jgi:hypothetical protein
MWRPAARRPQAPPIARLRPPSSCMIKLQNNRPFFRRAGLRIAGDSPVFRGQIRPPGRPRPTHLPSLSRRFSPVDIYVE